jgi:hypothetical protein
MEKTFVAVEPGRRVAVRHEQVGHTFILDMAFEPVEAGTRLAWRATFDTPAQLSAVRAAFAKANDENMDRLSALLATGASSSQVD